MPPIFSARSLHMVLSNVGTEVLIFLGTELLVRFFIPSPTRRTDRLKLLSIQGCILFVAALLLHLYRHRPFLLVLITVFIFIRFISVYSAAVNVEGGTAHVHVSKPLPKSVRSGDESTMHWCPAGGGGVSTSVANLHQPVTHAPSASWSAFRSNTIGLPPPKNGSTLLQRSAASNGPRLQQTRTPHHKPEQETSSRVKSGYTYPTGDHFTNRQSVQPLGVATSNMLSRTLLKSSHVGATVPASHPYGYPTQSYLQYISSIWNHKKPSKCPPGISNSGNVCFINSTLQTLAWTPGFIEGLKITADASSAASAKAQLLKSLHSVLDRCHVLPDGVSSFSAVDSSLFLKDVSELAPYLVALPQSGQRQTQQDASEFLLWLLDNLESDAACSLSAVSSDVFSSAAQQREECLVQLCNANSDDIRTFREPLSKLAEADWTLQSNKGSHLTRDLFLGQMVEARVCQKCKKMSVNVEYFTVLPLPIPESQQGSIGGSLIDCFKCFGTVEELTSSNMMVCSCSPAGSQHEMILTPGMRLAMLSRLPKRMIIQLTRFSYDTALKSARKNATPITLPTSIDTTPYLMESKLKNGSAIRSERRAVYTLYALCVHTGAQSTSFGHYVAYCRVPNGTWYCFNDSYVSVVANMEQELQTATVLQNAYLLFYAALE